MPAQVVPSAFFTEKMTVWSGTNEPFQGFLGIFDVGMEPNAKVLTPLAVEPGVPMFKTQVVMEMAPVKASEPWFGVCA
jgi:hypothetical protein